jgi:hypothetical protein
MYLIFSQNLKPSQITFYKTYSACWLFRKSRCFKSGFWKTPIWKPNQRFFNLKEMQATVHSFYKDLGIFFHFYLLSTVREKIYTNLPWWKEILTIQSSWSFLWIEKKPIIFTVDRDRSWGHSVFWGEAPQNTKWPPDWAASYSIFLRNWN